MTQSNLILLHGALGSKEQFASLIPLLEIKGTVHSLDFEGHGQAAIKNRPFSTEHFAENVLDYMEEHNLRTVSLFGYSMGGYVALYLARQHPNRVRRIFTFATKLTWTSEIAAKEASLLDPDRLLEKAPKFTQALDKRHVETGWRDMLLKTMEMTLRQGREALLTESDFQDILTSVRVSMGDRDEMVSIEETLKIYRLLPNAQLQIFPGTPHIIEQVSKKMLANAINSFFMHKE